jgi:hypothetical protein
VSDQQPLTSAQRQTAAELPWYRAWLLATGRTQAELQPESDLQRRDDLP